MGRRRLDETQATPEQVVVVKALAEFGRPASCPQLANYLGGKDSPYKLGSRLDAMRQRGWVVSDVRPEGPGGRTAFYSLTPSGAALAARGVAPRPDPEDGDDYADRAAWRAHGAMARGR